VDNKHCQVFVAVRPGTKEFLETMAKHYEVVIFTASLSNYANPLMDLLDPDQLCTSRLFREHCTFNGRFFTKDMSLLGRRIEDVILVDNNPNSYYT
jgi:RNA polymerase II subunit A small phosphatase-like protein